jgi:hypothetical protein
MRKKQLKSELAKYKIIAYSMDKDVASLSIV